MSYCNLQLQNFKITIESQYSGNNRPELAVGTRFTPFGQYTKITPGRQEIDQVLDLGQTDQLRVLVRGLVPGDVVTIVDIEVSDITLQHYIYQGRQYQPAVTNYYQPGTEFHYDGVFELDITLPVWRWIMNHIEREISDHRT